MKAMTEANCKINPTQSSKKQALDFVKDLQKVIPIERARMRIKISFESQEQLIKLEESLKSEHKADDF